MRFTLIPFSFSFFFSICRHFFQFGFRNCSVTVIAARTGQTNIIFKETCKSIHIRGYAVFLLFFFHHLLKQPQGIQILHILIDDDMAKNMWLHGWVYVDVYAFFFSIILGSGYIRISTLFLFSYLSALYSYYIHS